MPTSNWFVSASDARNNITKDIVVHGEISAIESQILLASQAGWYQTTVSNNTLMTNSSSPTIYQFTIDPLTGMIVIPNNPYMTGDAVQIYSTGELPPPLVANTVYYVIYVNNNTIYLSSTQPTISSIPSPIQLEQGVSTIVMVDNGTGYIQVPSISFTGGGTSTKSAQATAVLQTMGQLNSVSVMTPGSGLTDIPSVTVNATGQGCVLGPATFQVSTITVISGGSGYNVGDIITGTTGTGTFYSATVTTINAGSVTSVTLSNKGNYSVLPTLSGEPTHSNNSGTGATFTLSMGIFGISVTSGGSNYLSLPIITISGGGGNGATAIPVLTGGAVSRVTITTNGSGFTGQPSMSITSGSGATAIANIIPTSISSINVTNNGGNTYTSTPSISITPPGSGATIGSIYLRVVQVELVNGGHLYQQGDIITVSGGICIQPIQIQILRVNDCGHIVRWNIINRGSYSVLPQLNSNNMQGGTGQGASFNLFMGIDSITVSNGGTGYLTAPLIKITGGNGVCAVAYSVISGGIVTGIVVTDHGIGYTSIPTVTLSNGVGATASVLLTPTSIQSITVIYGGTNYNIPPNVSIVGGGGSGAIVTANVSGGAITGFNILNPGSGYTSNPQAIINGNAITEVVLVPTSVASITVTNGGSDYSSIPTITLSGAATAVAVLTPTGIQSITVTNGGMDYIDVPTLSWSPGAGQHGIPTYPSTLCNLSYGIDSVKVTESGNYTSVPTVVFSSPALNGTIAAATATLGYGTGTFSIQTYNSSQDYWLVWKNQIPSNPMMTRVYSDQMNAVISYFTGLGYTINPTTNPNTGNTISWNILW